MSNRITNAQRNGFLESVLRSTFQPRFEALWVKVDALAKAEVERQHPHWVRGRKDKDLLPYIGASHGVYVKFGDHYARKPTRWHGVVVSLVDCEYSIRYNNDGVRDYESPVSHPQYQVVQLKISEDDVMCSEHRAIWADFAAAQETLTATIFAYNNRAKFEVDFPDLAKHLPKPAKVVGTAIAVQVGDVMEKLAKVGIPPAVAEV